MSSRSARSSSSAPLLLATLATCLWLPGTAAALDALAKRMQGASVALVAPEEVFIRSEDRRATVKHNPLQGYEPAVYPALFAERAAKVFEGHPTRWQVRVLEPDATLWQEVSTEDPDHDPATTLVALPDEAASADYLAVFRYAELAYDVREQAKWSRNGNVYTVHFVELVLDLQLVIYEVASGEPVATYDAECPVEVTEIQAKPLHAKAFYKATSGALRRMRRAVASGG